jgi:predicted nucleotidyltransferase
MGTIDPNWGSTEPLSASLFGRVRREILGLLFSHPDEEFYFRQIVRLTGVGVGAAQRELGNLSSAGILLKSSRGRSVFYRVNQESPIFGELQSLILKTSGIVEVLRRALAPLEKDIHFALVFGSTAQKRLRAASDIDLMIVGNVGFGEIVSLLQEAQTGLGREINPVVYSPLEFRRRLREGHRFIDSILTNPHLFVVGNERELRRLVKKRLADSSRDRS